DETNDEAAKGDHNQGSPEKPLGQDRQHALCSVGAARRHERSRGARATHTTVPTSLPIPAVRAIANAPQKVTRAVARRMCAPPAFAPIAPRRARKPKDAADTMGTSAPAGDTTTMSKGMAAPTENITADVSAACTGRAVVISEIPSSSRAWAVKASFAISC